MQRGTQGYGVDRLGYPMARRNMFHSSRFPPSPPLPPPPLRPLEKLPPPVLPMYKRLLKSAGAIEGPQPVARVYVYLGEKQRETVHGWMTPYYITVVTISGGVA